MKLFSQLINNFRAVPSLMRGIWPLIRNSIATILVKGFLPRYLIFFVIAHYYLPNELTSVVLALSIFDIGKAIVDLGLDTISINLYAKEKPDNSSIFINIVNLKLVSSFIVYLIIITVATIVYPQYKQTILILGLSLFTSSLIGSYIAYYQSSLKVSQLLPSIVSGTIMFLFPFWLLIHYQVNVNYVCLLLPFTELVILAIIYRQSVEKKVISPFYFDRSLWGTLLRSSAPILITNIIVMMYIRGDIFLLFYFLGDRAVAEYGATMRLVEIFFFISAGSSISLYAEGSRSLNKKGEDSHIYSFLSLLIGGSFILFFLISVFAPQIIHLFLPKYPHAALILSILSWGFFFKFTNTHLTSLFYSYGNFSIITKLAAFNLFINITANLLLIPLCGVIGAAYALLLTEGINTILQVFILTKVYGLKRSFIACS